MNEEFAKLFIRLDLMEQTGFGVPRVTQSYGEEAFEFLDFFIRVTLPFAFEIEAEVVDDGTHGEPINKPINKEEGNNSIETTQKTTQKSVEKSVEKSEEKTDAQELPPDFITY